MVLATPSHLLPVLYPTIVHNVEAGELGPQLINKTVECRDQETDEVVTFTIQDYGTSHVKGEWFEIMYEDLTVLQITTVELKEMLANQVEDQYVC